MDFFFVTILWILYLCIKFNFNGFFFFKIYSKNLALVLLHTTQIYNQKVTRKLLRIFDNQVSFVFFSSENIEQISISIVLVNARFIEWFHFKRAFLWVHGLVLQLGELSMWLSHAKPCPSINDFIYWNLGSGRRRSLSIRIHSLNFFIGLLLRELQTK